MKATESQSSRQTSFFGDAAFAVASSVAARVLALGAMAVITRQYQAADYGSWILILAFAGLAVPLTTLRYEVALVLAPSSTIARRLLWAMLLSTGLVTALVMVALWLVSGPLMLRLSGLTADKLGWLALVPVMLMLMAAQLVLQAWLTRQKRLMAINFGALAQVIVASGVTIGGGWLYTPSAWIAVLGGIAGQVGVVALLAIATRATLMPALFHRPGLRNIRRAMAAYRVYPQYVLPYSLSVGLTERITQVAMSAMFSVSFLGAFYAARQIIQAPAQIISASFRNVLLAHGARQGSLAETRPYVRSMLTAYSLTVAPMLALGVEWIEDVVAWALGTGWPNIETLAWWCMFPSAILLLTGSMDRLFDLAGRQRLATGMQVASDIVMLGALLATWYSDASGTAVVAILSIVQTAYNLIWLAVILRIIGLDWRYTIGRVVLFGAVFLFSWGTQWLLRDRLEAATSLGIGAVLALASSGLGAMFIVRRRRRAGPMVVDRTAAAG